MANFNVHLGTAVAGGTLLGHLGWSAGIWSGEDLFLIITLTTIGGLLPDIDAENSKSIRLVFSILGLIAMVVASIYLHGAYPLWVIIFVCAAIFMGMRHLVAPLFMLFAVHRGNAHSLMMMVVSGAVVACVCYRLGVMPIVAWSYGFALMFGVLIHLLLDELYAIDYSELRLKKSFGSAIKPITFKHPWSAFGMVFSLAPLFFLVPPLSDAWALITYVAPALGPVGDISMSIVSTLWPF